MEFYRPVRTALHFEELEPRLLFSADLIEVDIEVLEQEYAEEQAVTADQETASEAEEAEDAADQKREAEDLAEPDEEMETAAGGTGTAEETDEPEAGAVYEPEAAAPGKESEDESGADKEQDKDSEEDKDADVIATDAETNVPPTISAPDSEVGYTPGDPPVILAPEVAVSDGDSDNFFGGTLTVSISAGGGEGDELSIVEGGDVTLLNKNIKVEEKLVGSFAGGTNGTALVISWSPQATPDCTAAVLRQIAYGNGDPAETGSRTVDFVLTDGDGGTGNTLQVTVNGTEGSPGGDVDDPGQEAPPGENAAPVLTLAGEPIEYVGGEQAVLVASTATVTDSDSADFKQGTLTVRISQGGSSGDQLMIAPGGNVTLLNDNIKVDQKLVGRFAGGTDGTALIISWTPQATPASAEAVLRQIAYSNGSAEIGSRTIDVVLTDGDGGTSNCVQSIVNLVADTGLPGGDPGQGEGGGDPGSGETQPADNPVAQPVDEQKTLPEEKPEAVPSGGNVEDSQEQNPVGGDAPAILTPVSPNFEIAVQDAETIAVVDLAPTLDEASIGQTSIGISEEQNGSIHETGPAAWESELSLPFESRSGSGVENVSPEALANLDGVGERDACFSPELQATAVQGQGAGDVSQPGAISAAIKTTIGRLLDFFSPSTALAAPISHSVSDGESSAVNEKVCREVEIMRQEMEEAFVQSANEGRLVVYTTTGASLSLTAGIARYFFRSGTLLSGFLATIPLWKGFDPVAILSTPKGHPKNATKDAAAEVETVHQKAEIMFARGDA